MSHSTRCNCGNISSWQTSTCLAMKRKNWPYRSHPLSLPLNYRNSRSPSLPLPSILIATLASHRKSPTLTVSQGTHRSILPYSPPSPSPSFSESCSGTWVTASFYSSWVFISSSITLLSPAVPCPLSANSDTWC